ncbi:MAG: GNAT family N-acetyltransferase [Defluviitaleaceae bacterium]|nr:GNAT family N-acetyltransferase [Defluviitaleaceae bacterium]
MNFQIKNATELTTIDTQDALAKIFVDGFYPHLKIFSKDKATLRKALHGSFHIEDYFVARDKNQIVGMVSVQKKDEQGMTLNRRQMIKQLGLIKGNLAYFSLNKFMIKKPWPIELEENTLIIGFVSTDESYLRKGVSSQIFKHIFDVNSTHDFVLYTESSNEKALNLYNKLGFKEFLRLPEKHAKRAGFDSYVYMKRSQSTLITK